MKHSGVSICDNRTVTGELEERNAGNGNITLWIGFWNESKTMWQNHKVYVNTVKEIK